VLDAMAHGVPVIASNRSALPEVAGEAGSLVDPLDVEAWAAALTDLSENPSRRRELAECGMRRASQFTWTTAVERTWNAYAECR